MRWRISAHRSHSQLILWFILGFVSNLAAATQPDLLITSKQLECAQDAQQAANVLHTYKNIKLPQLPLPNEWFNSEKPPALHAASLDIALQALTSASRRFPELALEVEQIVLQWGYCEVFLDDTFYDFITVNGQMNRLLADVTSPIDWGGFHSLGFFGEHEDRLVIDAFKHDDAPFVFYEVDYSMMFRQQCLPHPQTSQLFFDSETYFPWRVVHDGYKANEPYPYEWQAGCAVETEKTLKQAQAQPPIEASLDSTRKAGSSNVIVPINAQETIKSGLDASVEIEAEAFAATAGTDWDAKAVTQVPGQTESQTSKETKAEVGTEPIAASLVSAGTEAGVVRQSQKHDTSAITHDEISPLALPESVHHENAPNGASITETLTENEVATANHGAEPDAYVSTTRSVSPTEAAQTSDIRGLPDVLVENDKTNSGETLEPSVATGSIPTPSDDDELNSPVRHELTLEERELMIARSVLGYRYEITEMQKSLKSVATGPGYHHYTSGLRPQQPGNTVLDYVSVRETESPLLYGIAEHIVPLRLPLETVSPLPIDDNKALFASAPVLGQRWLDEIRNQSYGSGKPRVGIVRKSTRDTALSRKQKKQPDLAALNTVPVIVAEGGVAPIVVFDLEPEPIEEISKPEPLRTKKKKHFHGFNGFITLGNRSFDSDGVGIITGASYKPVKNSYWFARSSWNYRIDDEEFRYTWGVGYDDWHPGTWAVQLNHWGPLRPGDYLDIDNAVASITYKFKTNNFTIKNRVSSSVTLSQKISGEPVLSWSNSWSPKGKWFIRSTISQPVKGGELSWSYGFGRSNYSPFTWSIEYNNFGYNKAFEYNFKDNASLSMTYRWRY